MKNNNYLIGLFLIGVLSIGGCGSEGVSTNIQTQDNLTITEEPTSKLSTKDPLEMALALSDFSEGWEITVRAERVRSEVSRRGLDLGWKEGYVVVFLNQDPDNPLKYEKIEQYISIYPIENIEAVSSYETTENTTYEELSNPNIGDLSHAYKVTIKPDEFGFGGGSNYQIVFSKKDVVMNLMSTGTTQDYELLKEMAKKAEGKID